MRDDLPGAGHVLVQADMADADAVGEMVDRAAEDLGGLDVLVNNAGVFTAHPPLSTSYADWQAAWSRTLAVNLMGAANATFRAVPHLIAAGGGAVVNVTSRGRLPGRAEQPRPTAPRRPGSTRSRSRWRWRWRRTASRSAAVAPGFVQTEMAREVLDGPGGDAVRAQSPFGRVARPEEVASAVVWLASPEARFSSGTIVDVNGASYLRS